jgi:hypothetical protein
MLLFRTILLWLAFFLLILQNFVIFNNFTLGLIFRLVPTGILVLWFLLSIFIKDNMKLRPEKLKRHTVILINILRPAASLSIVLGAIFKIMHWPFGTFMLVSGIGFMAVYSTLLSIISKPRDEYNPDILDDSDD